MVYGFLTKLKDRFLLSLLAMKKNPPRSYSQLVKYRRFVTSLCVSCRYTSHPLASVEQHIRLSTKANVDPSTSILDAQNNRSGLLLIPMLTRLQCYTLLRFQQHCKKRCQNPHFVQQCISVFIQSQYEASAAQVIQVLIFQSDSLCRRQLHLCVSPDSVFLVKDMSLQQEWYKTQTTNLHTITQVKNSH